MASKVQGSYCEAEENSEIGSACQLPDTDNKCSDKYRSNLWNTWIIRFWNGLFDGIKGTEKMEEKVKETKEGPREMDDKPRKIEEPNHDQDGEYDSMAKKLDSLSEKDYDEDKDDSLGKKLDSLSGKDYDQDSTEKDHGHFTSENLVQSEDMYIEERDREYSENYKFEDLSNTVCSTGCNEGHCEHATPGEIDGFELVSSSLLELGTQNDFISNHNEIVENLQTEDQVDFPSVEELYEDGNIDGKESPDNARNENYASPNEEESVKLENPDLSKDYPSKPGLLAPKGDEQKTVDIALNKEHMDSTEYLPCYFMYNWWQPSTSTTTSNIDSIPTEETMEKLQSFKKRKMRKKETDVDDKFYKNLERQFKEKQCPKKTNLLYTNQSSSELEMSQRKRNKKGCFLGVLMWILGIPDTTKRVPRKPFSSMLDKFFAKNPLETSTSEEDEPQEFSHPIDWKKLIREV